MASSPICLGFRQTWVKGKIPASRSRPGARGSAGGSRSGRHASQAEAFSATPLIPIGGGVQIGRGISLAGGGPAIDDPRVSRVHAESRAPPAVITSATSGAPMEPSLTGYGSTNRSRFTTDRSSASALRLRFSMIPRTALAAVGEELATPFGPVPTVSAEAAMIIRRLRALARVDLDLLITGDTGVGKRCTRDQSIGPADVRDVSWRSTAPRSPRT